MALVFEAPKARDAIGKAAHLESLEQLNRSLDYYFRHVHLRRSEDTWKVELQGCQVICSGQVDCRPSHYTPVLSTLFTSKQ